MSDRRPLAAGSAALRPSPRHLALVGLAAFVSASLANLAIRALATGPFGLPADFPPFLPVAIVLSTFVGAFGAAVVFAVVGRFFARPARPFIIISAVALIASLVPNALLLAAPDAAPFPGTSPATLGALAAMHVASAVVIVSLLVFQFAGPKLQE